MGKSTQGVFGNWWGKVGNVVGRVRQGRTVLSIYQPNVSNPRTAEQMAVRNRFSLLTKILSSVTTALAVGFKDLDGYKTGNYYSAAVGYNYKRNPFEVDQQGNILIVPKDLMLSQGTLDLPFSPSANVDGEDITVSWSDNSGLGNASATDKVTIVCLNITKNQAVVNSAVAERSSRTATVSVNGAWSGDQVAVYLFMTSDQASREDKSVSDSTHLGTFTI